MARIHNLTTTTDKGKKRIGRGYGSGVGGHTTSKGQKGQKTRSNPGLLFQGTKSNKDFFHQTPWLRGKSRLKSYAKEPVRIKLSQLESLKEGAEVTVESLVKAGIITEKQAKQQSVKILFDKAIAKKLVIKVPASEKVISQMA